MLLIWNVTASVPKKEFFILEILCKLPLSIALSRSNTKTSSLLSLLHFSAAFDPDIENDLKESGTFDNAKKAAT